jgi:choline dehydrogenase-like flavoprotein
MAIAKHLDPMIDMWTNKDPRKSLDHVLARFGESIKDYDSSKDDHKEYELFTRIEQAPNLESRVTLDKETDALGVPRASLHWILTPLEKRSLRKIYELIGQQVGRAGIGRIKMMDFLKDEKDNSWPSFAGGGWHHMGTTRMSNDPREGVVDANCKVHGIDNLFVAGSSCYTTAAAPNPTLTLIALTLRLSDHVKIRMAEMNKKAIIAGV